MKVTKRILVIMLTLVGIGTGAWAIEQDTDGYYLIANTDDWDAFAAQVQTNPSANAKLTADIATVTTMLGSESKEFAGVFDGKGHTLTVSISGSSKFVAPFHYVKGGTIKNLRVEGTVSSSNIHMSGLIGRAYDEVSIENCVVAANIQMYADYAGGFVGNGGSRNYGGPSKVVMRNCVFIGSFTGMNGTRDKVSAFWGWGLSTPVFINCLENGSYTNISGFNPFMFEGTENQNTETTANSYYMHGSITLEGVSDASSMSYEDVVDLLGDAWELDPITNQPILKMFVSLKQDADGYYEIGSVKDWQNFAKLVEKTPNVNAKMTADIDLGDDLTMVGDGYASDASKRIPFKGTFDGQGHTLTINYVTAQMPTSQQFFGCAPFGYVIDGTIRNLHIAGTIVSSHEGVAGLIGYADGKTLIENCYSSVDFTFNGYDALGGAGFVYYTFNDASVLTIRDCIYDGTISGQRGYNAGFVVWYPYSTCNISNSLVTATINSDSYDCCTFIRPNTSNYTLTNCYYKTPLGTAQGIQATADDLSNGTTTAALNNNRTGVEAPWVQQGDQPMLKVFASEGGIITGIDSGQRSKGLGQRDGWYTIDGRKLYGKPKNKGIYINNGNKVVIK